MIINAVSQRSNSMSFYMALILYCKSMTIIKEPYTFISVTYWSPMNCFCFQKMQVMWPLSPVGAWIFCFITFPFSLCICGLPSSGIISQQRMQVSEKWINRGGLKGVQSGNSNGLTRPQRRFELILSCIGSAAEQFLTGALEEYSDWEKIHWYWIFMRTCRVVQLLFLFFSVAQLHWE